MAALYPFLNTTSKSRPFEYLRLTSLGVIGALLKKDSADVISFLDNRDHPLMPSKHGDGLGAQQDCRHLHCPKDSPG